MSVDDIVLENVSFTYEGSSEPAIRDINLRIPRGQVALVTGPAGAGKTTLCYCLNGLIPNFYYGQLTGRVTVRGLDPTRTSIGRLARDVGYLFQDPSMNLFCPTVEDEMAFGPENFGLPPCEIERRTVESLGITRLEKYRLRNPHYLSGGQQQACAVGAILTMRSNILLLDEPTSNLDPLGSANTFTLIRDLMSREQKTLIMVEHKIQELAPIVDRMIVMNEGRIILDGEPREVLKNADEMESLGLKVPHASMLATRVIERGVRFDNFPITADEIAQDLKRLMKARTAVPRLNTREGSTAEENDVAIEAKDLSHTYPPDTAALRHVSLTIRRGEFIGIIGQNGSGKTTLVKHFIGLLKPTKGKVTVFDKDISQATPDELATRVGFCFQNPDHQIFSDNVKKEIEFGLRNIGLPKDEIESRTREALEKVKLLWAIDRDPFSLGLGERRRLGVATVLAMKPEILIVDEPTTGQDFRGGVEIMNLTKTLNDEGKTVLVITHDMELASQFVNRVIVLKDGEIMLDGPTREVFSKTDQLSQTSIRPPQITMIAQKLNDYLPGDVLSVEEMLEVLPNSIFGAN